MADVLNRLICEDGESFLIDQFEKELIELCRNVFGNKATTTELPGISTLARIFRLPVLISVGSAHPVMEMWSQRFGHYLYTAPLFTMSPSIRLPSVPLCSSASSTATTLYTLLQASLPYVQERLLHFAKYLCQLLLHAEHLSRESGFCHHVVSRAVNSVTKVLAFVTRHTKALAAITDAAMLLLFLSSSPPHYLSLTDVICGVYPIPTSSSTASNGSSRFGSQAKLKAIIWLVALRLSLLVARLVEQEEETAAAETDDTKDVQADDDGGTVDLSILGSKPPSQQGQGCDDRDKQHALSRLKCPLCRGQVYREGCCLPCGHVFCWRCIMLYHNSKAFRPSAASSNTVRSVVECSVCRHPYLPQLVRPLYLWSGK